jgi:hypothetical protein
MGSVIFVKMPYKLLVELKTTCFRYKKTYPNRIFSLSDTIQDIFLFLTFRFCRDWEFGSLQTQAQERSSSRVLELFARSFFSMENPAPQRNPWMKSTGTETLF